LISSNGKLKSKPEKSMINKGKPRRLNIKNEIKREKNNNN
jgi:hypothetical protein